MAALFEVEGHAVIPHDRDLASLNLCDVEVVGPIPYKRLEVKTWRLLNWKDLGRCIHVGQIEKIEQTADGIVWCTVPLPYIRSASDLANYKTLIIDMVGFSLLCDVKNAPICPDRTPK